MVVLWGLYRRCVFGAFGVLGVRLAAAGTCGRGRRVRSAVRPTPLRCSRPGCAVELASRSTSAPLRQRRRVSFGCALRAPTLPLRFSPPPTAPPPGPRCREWDGIGPNGEDLEGPRGGRWCAAARLSTAGQPALGAGRPAEAPRRIASRLAAREREGAHEHNLKPLTSPASKPGYAAPPAATAARTAWWPRPRRRRSSRRRLRRRRFRRLHRG